MDNTNNKVPFNMRLAELRSQKDWKQDELGDMLNLSRGAISRYETGSNEPDIAKLKKPADIFGVSIDYLVGHTDYELSCEVLDERLKGQHLTLGAFLDGMQQLDADALSFLVKALTVLLAGQGGNEDS